MTRVALSVSVVLLAACGTSHSSPVECGEGDYVAVGGNRYCVYDESVVIVGGFHCPSELPRLLGDPAVICSDQPVEQPIPGEVCARAPRSCQMPALDGGPPGAPVGGACVPEAVPENGFLSSEVYLETSHAACSSEQCLVYRLMGDPRPGCTGPTCASAAEIAARVMCTCRCSGAGALCTCPSGTRCEDGVLVSGPLQGGYCVPVAP